jgi:hypothetical protein
VGHAACGLSEPIPNFVISIRDCTLRKLTWALRGETFNSSERIFWQNAYGVSDSIYIYIYITTFTSLVVVHADGVRLCL